MMCKKNSKDKKHKKMRFNIEKILKKEINKFIKKSDNDKEFLESISQAANKIENRFSTIEKIIQEVLS